MLTRTGIVAASMLIVASTTTMQEKGGIDKYGPYDVIEGWLKPVEDGWYLHPVSVFAESPDRIFIASTGATPKATAPPGLTTFNPKVPGAKLDHHLVVVNRNGEVVERWTQWYDRFGSPHKVTSNPYDPEKHIWFVDRSSQQVMQFTNDGTRLVMAVGERGVAGNDDRHFNLPTDIAFLPDGTFFVSDGDRNTRVVKFDRNGRFLQAWEAKGTGRLGPVHSIAVDSRRRVYVADGAADAVALFDERGRFLEEWTDFVSLARVMVAEDQSVWVLDMGANRLARFNPDGRLLTYWGTAGTFPGGFATPHDLSVDSEGNLYISNGFNHVVDKYVPKNDADRARLVGQSLRPSAQASQGRTLTELVAIPAGAFTMGSRSGPADERPEHRVELAAFSIEKTPVTNRQFAEFMNTLKSLTMSGRELYQPDDGDARIHRKGTMWVADPGAEQFPVVEPSWYGAREYCRWAGRRLPTEAEWEKAARGTDGRRYPWGNAAPDRKRAHFGGGWRDFVPIGSFPAGASAYGVLDMAGNGWEWTSSAYRPYPYNAKDGRENPDADVERVTRGGGQDSDADEITTTYRGRGLSREPDGGHHNIGFRCAQ